MSVVSVHDILEAGGIPVLDARVAPRPGSFNPIGVLCHHTANPQAGDLPSLHLLQHGRADLAGPLVQLGAGRAGTIASVTDGRANHAGRGSDVVAARIRADLPPGKPGPDNADGNALFVGIEIENAGNGRDPYTEAQWTAVVETCAALCHHFGWSVNHVIGHKEWTTRKPDPSFDMPTLRVHVAALLSSPSEPTHPPEAYALPFLIINDNNDATQDQYYFWPEMGEKGRKAIIPDGAALASAQKLPTCEGSIKFDRPDLEAIPRLRD